MPMLRKIGTPLLILPLSLGLSACSRDEPPEPVARSPQELSALAEAAGIAPAAMLPRFGGRPVVAGPRVVEVMPRADGSVEAEVRDATGAPVTNASVEVQVPTQAGAPQPVPLRYDPQQAKYVGQAPADAVVVPGRVDVTVRPRGEGPTTGFAEAVPVAPTVNYGGEVVVVGPQAPEVRVEADGKVHAYVDTEDGELPDGDLYVTVPVEQGPPVKVELEYDDDEAHYVGTLDEDVVVVPGPLEVELDVDGVQHRGRLATYTVGPRVTLGGDVVVAGDYGVEMVEVDGEIHAAVYDVRGRPLEHRPPRVVVHVHGHPQPVVLRWNASLGLYVSPLGPGFTLVGAPLRVEIRQGGHVHRGRFYYHSGPPGRRVGQRRGHPHHPHGGPPGHADVRVRVAGPSGMVHVAGPSAMVHVSGPSAMVRVSGPSAMASVRTRTGSGMASVRVRSGGGGGGGGMSGMGGGMDRH